MSSKNFDHTNAKNVGNLGVITESEWKNTSILQDKKITPHFQHQILHLQ